MNYETFFNDIDKKLYFRVSKKVARKHFLLGHNIIIAPVNYNMNALFSNYIKININNYKDFYNLHDITVRISLFDIKVNEYIFYNCNNELGLYPKFFISEVKQ